MTRWMVTVGLAALVGCGGTTTSQPRAHAAATSPATDHSAGAPADPKQEIRDTVFDALRAGFERHDVDAYLAAWTDDAQLVIGRGPESSQYDTTWDHEHLVASRRMRFSGEPPPDQEIEHTNTVVRLEGDDHAELDCRTTTRNGEHVEVVDEVYGLRKTGDGWRIALNRAWPVRAGTRGEVIEYDADEYRQLDAAVDDALEDGPSLVGVRALMAAWRFQEAYDLALEIASNQPTEAALRSLAGLATLLGDRRTALESYHRIREGDPEADIPGWAREAGADASDL